VATKLDHRSPRGGVELVTSWAIRLAVVWSISPPTYYIDAPNPLVHQARLFPCIILPLISQPRCYTGIRER
jgi:hypothetical protein